MLCVLGGVVLRHPLYNFGLQVRESSMISAVSKILGIIELNRHLELLPSGSVRIKDSDKFSKKLLPAIEKTVRIFN